MFYLLNKSIIVLLEDPFVLISRKVDLFQSFRKDVSQVFPQIVKLICHGLYTLFHFNSIPIIKFLPCEVISMMSHAIIQSKYALFTTFIRPC